MNEERKKILIIFIMLIIGIIGIISISYASWKFSYKQNDFNLLGSKCLEISLEGMSDGINLLNGYPMSDEEGKSNEGYTFTIKNICNTIIYYQLNLEEILLEEKELSSEYIRILLNDFDIRTINDLKEAEKTLTNAKKAYQLDTGLLGPVGSGDDEAAYSLKLWMDEYTPVINEVMNATFKSKVSVTATDVVEEEMKMKIIHTSSNDVTVANLSYTDDEISADINLPNADSSVTLNATLLNLTNEEYALLSLKNLPDNLTYEIKNYKLEEAICDINNKCSNGIEKNITILLKYKTDGYDSTNTSFDISMLFDFEKIHNLVEITFDANGGIVDTLTKDVYYKREYGTLPVAVRDGYTFSGWAVEPSGKEMITEKTLVNNSESHTLYAQWNAKNYTIRYHANGGTGAMADQVIKYDAIVSLSKNTFAKDGYSFFGWSATEDGEKVYNNNINQSFKKMKKNIVCINERN